MKCLSIFLIFCSFSVLSGPSRDNNDLTHFDQPFLLGDWYFLNPKADTETDSFLAVRLTLASDYSFSIDIQKPDYSIENWSGLFAVDEETLILGFNSDEPQVYEYQSNHHKLNLNGVLFTKALSNGLAGIWSSVTVSGDDKQAKNINQMDLILRPDFLFTFRVRSDTGKEAIHNGVYYTENDRLVLLYQNGEHDTTYTLTEDELTLEVEDGDMFAVLNRIR